jgi:osmotically-inducible protein OsmY
MIRTDLGLHAAVRAALRGTLGATATRVCVVVRDGVVTLSGVVDTPHDKVTVERAVQDVPGVRAVVEELQAVGERGTEMTDEQIAGAVLKALEAGVHPIGRDLTIKVEHGWVVIAGRVASSAESAAVERALECVPAVRGVTSEVRVQAQGEVLAGNRVSPVESVVPPTSMG